MSELSSGTKGAMAELRVSIHLMGLGFHVVSKSGLQVVEYDGRVSNVYSNPDWMARDNK